MRTLSIAAALLGTAASHAEGQAPGSTNPGQTARSAQVPPSLPTSSPPASWSSPPKPGPVQRGALATAFTKAAPTSIADFKSIERHVKALVSRVSPAVVAVEVGDGSGSGVVISADGLVLTAGHVCGKPNRDVRFTFPDGRTARGKTLGVDPKGDTGLMRIIDSRSWSHVDPGDLDRAHVGDWVLALGHPGGFDIRRSLIVRLGRIIRLAPDAVQTDCTITGGDSGGALFDMHGRVIGIHSYISGAATANFHVPITKFYGSWDRLVKGDGAGDPSPQLAYLGASGVDSAEGCRLDEIDENGPAAKAGLRVGDLVLRIEDREVRSSAWLRHWVAEAKPGEALTLDIKRGDKMLSLSVKLESRTRQR